MSIETISDWFATRGVPPLLAGAVLGVAILLLFKALVRPRADRGEPSPLDQRLARPASARAKVKVTSTTTTLPPEISGEVLELIQAGNKIEAIKLVREATGLGLKESKDVVDGLSTAFGK